MGIAIDKYVYCVVQDYHADSEGIRIMLRCQPNIIKPFCSAPLSHVMCSEEHIATVVQQALQEAAAPATGLSFEDFQLVLKGSPLHMQVDVPSDA